MYGHSLVWAAVEGCTNPQLTTEDEDDSEPSFAAPVVYMGQYTPIQVSSDNEEETMKKHGIELQKKIGSGLKCSTIVDPLGSFATVWKATFNGQTVAVKLLQVLEISSSAH